MTKKKVLLTAAKHIDDAYRLHEMAVAEATEARSGKATEWPNAAWHAGEARNALEQALRIYGHKMPGGPPVLPVQFDGTNITGDGARQAALGFFLKVVRDAAGKVLQRLELDLSRHGDTGTAKALATLSRKFDELNKADPTSTLDWTPTRLPGPPVKGTAPVPSELKLTSPFNDHTAVENELRKLGKTV
jgi:hypothetical protein